MSGNMMMRTKIILLFFIVAAICVITMGGFLYSITRRNVEKNAIESNVHLVRQIDNNINVFQNNLWNITSLIILNPEKYATNTSIQEIFTVEKQRMSLIVLYWEGNSEGYRYYSDSSMGLVSFDDFRTTRVYEDAVNYRGKPVWFVLGKNDTSIIVNPASERIIMARSVRDLQASFEEKGILLLGSSIEIIGELCGTGSLTPGQSLMVTDKELNPLYSYGKKFNAAGLFSPHVVWNEGVGVFERDGRRMFAFRSSENKDNWNVFLLMEENSLFGADALLMIFLVLLVVCIILAAALFLVYLLSGILTNPIQSLVEAMDSLETGNWEHHVKVTSSDEIGKLGARYNLMVDKLHALINENYILALREREAELNALQAQINPHFLYNMLNIIYFKSVEAGQKDLARIILSLSELFRLTLNSGKAWITVSAEVDLLEVFLSLQKSRFQDRLDYSINIDPELYECHIPKLILQPLVENAVIHGVEKQKEMGTVEVSGTMENRRLLFTVRDNGAGMTADQLNCISREINPGGKSRSGYGLWNIRERLQMYYGGNFLFEFESSPGKGVLVRLEIPVKENPESGTC